MRFCAARELRQRERTCAGLDPGAARNVVGRKFPRRPPEGRPLFCVPSSPRCRDADKTYTVKILGGSFPIDEGTTQVGPFLLYCCGDKDCFPVACDQLVGTVYGWLYVPAGNLFDAEQGATAKAIGDAFGISEESVRCIIEATSGQPPGPSWAQWPCCPCCSRWQAQRRRRAHGV